ncbi:MAG: hypothetical protein HPY85_11050 [Anaerolineae bacterium]|nr:hypothetical protein [Anaerolineae bacterium]
MPPILTVVIFAVLTVLVFIFTEPRKRPELGAVYWSAQSRPPHELAKTFAYTGQTDRLVEMLQLDHELLPNAREYQAAAARTGVPMLFRSHSIDWDETERIIKALLNLLPVLPFEVTHAFVVLGIDGNLGSMERAVNQAMVAQLTDPGVQADEEKLIRFCISISYLGPSESVNPLVKLMNNDKRMRVRNAARHALQNMGYSL